MTAGRRRRLGVRPTAPRRRAWRSARRAPTPVDGPRRADATAGLPTRSALRTGRGRHRRPGRDAPARRAQLERALAGHVAAIGPRRAVDGGRAQRAPGAGRRIGSPSRGCLPADGPGGGRRAPAGAAPARGPGAPGRARRARARAAGAPLAGCASPPRRHAARPARPSGPRARRPRRRSTSTRRPCATGSPSCARTSATRSTTRSGASSSRWRCAPSGGATPRAARAPGGAPPS